MTLRGFLIASAIALTAFPAAVDAAESCGANAIETGRSVSNGKTTLTCRCADGYVQGGGGCVAASPTPKAGPPFRLSGFTTSGQVSVMLPDGSRLTPSEARSRGLSPGTRIATGDLSVATIDFGGGSTVRIGPNSVFAIEAPPGKQGFLYRMAAGLINLKEVGLKWGRIRTPTAVVAVRGTEVTVKTGSNGTTVTLRSGIVDLLDRNGAVMLTLQPGQEVDISAQGIAGTPRRAP